MLYRETEVKIAVADLQAIRKRLLQAGFRLAHRRSLEDNFLFDTAERRLRQARSILRLRQYGGKWIVTFKGTPAADSRYKSRLELETEVKSPEAMRSIFVALGLVPAFRYQKFRSHYAPAEPPARGTTACEVALDETPIGNYIELEGSRSWIDRVARQLGYSRSDYSTASYGALYLEDCRKRNVPPGDMVFGSAKKPKQSHSQNLQKRS